MGKKGKRKHKYTIDDKYKDSGFKKNFTTSKKVADEVINNSGGIIKMDDIKNIFKIC